MNHNRIRNVLDDKDKSLISEYPIDKEKFDLVFDYPDLVILFTLDVMTQTMIYS